MQVVIAVLSFPKDVLIFYRETFPQIMMSLRSQITAIEGFPIKNRIIVTLVRYAETRDCRTYVQNQ